MTLQGTICIMSADRKITYTITQALNDYNSFVVVSTDSERVLVYTTLVEAIQETLKKCL